MAQSSVVRKVFRGQCQLHPRHGARLHRGREPIAVDMDVGVAMTVALSGYQGIVISGSRGLRFYTQALLSIFVGSWKFVLGPASPNEASVEFVSDESNVTKLFIKMHK